MPSAAPSPWRSPTTPRLSTQLVSLPPLGRSPRPGPGGALAAETRRDRRRALRLTVGEAVDAAQLGAEADGVVDVALGGEGDVVGPCHAQLDHRRGALDRQGAAWAPGVVEHHRVGGDDGAAAHDDTVEHDRPVADQGAVSDGEQGERCGRSRNVPDGRRCIGGRVHDAAILHAGAPRRGSRRRRHGARRWARSTSAGRSSPSR